MFSVVGAAVSRLRVIPLLLTMLALIAGIVGMHVLAGGHGPGTHGSPPRPAAAVLATSSAHPETISQTGAHDHQTHHGVSLDPGNPVMEVLGLAGSTPGPVAAEVTAHPHPECHHASSDLTVLNCVLALTLFGLAVLVRRTFWLRLPASHVSLHALLFLRMGITPRSLSPLQLSISRT